MTLALTTTFGVAWANEKLLALLRTNYQPRPPWGYHCDATVLGGAVLTYSKKRGNLDGDKLVCDPGATLAQRADSPCRVVSVGSNGDMSFENATRTAAPHCAIDTWDGTLGGHNVAKKRMKLEAAKWLNFIPRNFEPSSWQFYAHASNHSKGWRRHRPSVRLLKMDCEGCEFDSLRPWLTNVCTEQILIEVHGCACAGCPTSIRHNHTLRFERVRELMDSLVEEFAVFSVTPNTAFSDGTCLEYGLKRRKPCVSHASQEEA